MKKSKMLSLLVICAIILSLFPLSVSAASDANTHRSVYLHARGENPNGNNSKTTIYMGDNADVYFAVDNPNKGGYEDGEHTEPRYDMNGYTVRICFDPEYFDIASPNPTAPIDYTVPDENIETSGKDDVDIGVDTGEGVPQETGYFVYQSGDGTYTKAGKEYSTAYITVFFSGGYVPQKTDGKDWYNLAKLPLTPKKTGSTEVFIDTGNTPYTLELFAKDESGNKRDQTFTYNAVNDGSHTIEIISDTPAPPTANPQPDTYIEKQTVTLAQEENCTIYYTLDGTDPKTGGSKIKYTRPLDLTKTTEIKAYAHRERDGKDSTTATFNYKIRPDRPYLFDSNKTLISDTYSEKSKFSVYASAKNIFEVIPDDRDVYYTFGSSEAGSSAAG